nr:MAG TPA: Meiosis regulator and mRNA stability turnover, decapping, deadenylation-independent decapping [Caudoviricetes sp.]
MINRSRAICFASCPMMRMVYIFWDKKLDDAFAN